MTVKQQNRTPVAEWLIAQCQAHQLSWREASLRAGVDKGTISAIVRGHQPGLDVCKALAAFFRVPPEHLLRLAGHLEPVAEDLPPEVSLLLRELEQLPEPMQRIAVEAWRSILEGLKVGSPPPAK